MNNYFPFISDGDFKGHYDTAQLTSSLIETIGNICEPNDIIKLNVGNDVFSQVPETITYSNINLSITTLNESDWTSELKEEWVESYIKHVNLLYKLTPTQFNDILIYAESINIFEHLSSPSIAYVNKNDGTNGYNDDNFFTNEVSIGLNVYENNFIIDLANTTVDTVLRDVILDNHKKEVTYISNLCKVEYDGFSDIVYCFEKIEYDYDISNIGIVPSLTNGGGNMFGEVKLAGDRLQARYKVKKNVHENDPTIGFCSGESENFCMGDLIHIIDTTCWTSNGDNGWTWVGDFSVLPYEWHIADVSEPCRYYRNVSIFDMLFPLRIISFCKFEDFN